MARSRKTVDVDEVRIKINDMLRLSTVSRDVRRGMQTAIEEILYMTGNYKGFRYLDQTEVPEGQRPGIIPGSKTDPNRPGVILDNQFPDDSRVEYY